MPVAAKPWPEQSPFHQALFNVEKDIQRCYQKFSVIGSFEGVRAQHRKIGEALAEVGRLFENSPQNEEDRSDFEFARMSYSTLTTRIEIAARKQALSCPQSSKVPGMLLLQRALNRPRNDENTFSELLSTINKDSVKVRFSCDASQEPPLYMPVRLDTLPTLQYPTFSLAQIITKNPFGFTAQQICQLVAKLIEAGADFSIQDGQGHNPVNDLIRLSIRNTDFDALLVRLIEHCKGRIPEIFDHEGYYAPSQSTPIQTLIRHRKDGPLFELLKHLRSGLRIREQDLAFACMLLFDLPKGLACIEIIREQLLRQSGTISDSTCNSCIEYLKASPEEELDRTSKEQRRKQDFLHSWSDWAIGNQKQAGRMAKAMNLEPAAFAALCRESINDQNAFERIHQAMVEDIYFGSNLTGERERYNFMKTAEGKAVLARLIALFQPSAAG